MPHTREDVIAAIRTAFPASDASAIMAVLDLYGIEPYEREKERVQLAIVALSEGSEEKLLALVQTAKTDYRDILAWQETGPLTPKQGKKAQKAALRIIEQWGGGRPPRGPR
jgi:hypothetical protein